MMQQKPIQMPRPAASRIASAQARANGGQIPAASFASRADATVQRNASRGSVPQGKKG